MQCLTDSFLTGGGGGMSVLGGRGEEWIWEGEGMPDGDDGVGAVLGGERGGGGGEKIGGGGREVPGGVGGRGDTRDFR